MLPSASAASAASVIGLVVAGVPATAGEVRLTVGFVSTSTTIALEVLVTPWLSVALAVIEYLPVAIPL